MSEKIQFQTRVETKSQPKVIRISHLMFKRNEEDSVLSSLTRDRLLSLSNLTLLLNNMKDEVVKILQNNEVALVENPSITNLYCRIDPSLFNDWNWFKTFIL